jgi:predicted dehydrogenase
MLRAEIESFIACINTGTKPDVVTLRDARLGLLAADAIRESLRTETIVHA